MAQKFILLSVLWLVVAIFATSTRAQRLNTATPTTPIKDPCNPNPCGTGSTCQARANDIFVCLCLTGDFYNVSSKSCERYKVFPGRLHLKTEFNTNMTDPKSKEFNETADKITADLDKVCEELKGYSESIVLKLLPNTTSRSANVEKVDALVEIIFDPNSKIKEGDIVKKVTGCTDCAWIDKTFQFMNLCTNNACDEESTNCTSSDGTFNCTCNEGYMKSAYTPRICVACPLGEELKDNECVTCSFGYSGFNCSENWKLILVIVGSVLGGLLLIALILLPVVATQNSNKSSKKHKSPQMENPHTNHSFGSQPMASNKFGHSQGVSFNRSANGHSGFQNAGVSVFPRAANPTNGWDNRTNMEMNPSNGRQNFGRMNSGSRVYDEQEDMRPYAQARPQSNPYAQSQPKVNQYTQNQGHSNSYYTHDDGRRY